MRDDMTALLEKMNSLMEEHGKMERQRQAEEQSAVIKRLVEEQGKLSRAVDSISNAISRKESAQRNQESAEYQQRKAEERQRQEEEQQHRTEEQRSIMKGLLEELGNLSKAVGAISNDCLRKASEQQCQAEERVCESGEQRPVRCGHLALQVAERGFAHGVPRAACENPCVQRGTGFQCRFRCD